MIITPQALRGIYTAFNTVFNKAFEGQHPTYEKVATVVPSTSESETYAWLGDIPGMREWIGEREIQNLSGSAYTIKNKDFELTVGVDRNAVEDDKIGLYNPSIQMLGESAALHPDELVYGLLVVPPALEADARDILVADFINGTKNTMQGTAEIHVEPRLASDSAWFLLCTKRPVKPLIYQQRKKAKFVSKTNETDDNVFMSKKFIYGADSRGNAGFGFWQMAYGSDGTTT